MRKMIQNMKGHYIICGAGTMGKHVADELLRTCNKTVIIDTSCEKLDVIRKTLPGLGIMEGDATENSILEDAGIMRANGLIAATNSDKDNLLITVTARQMRADLRVVSRCGTLTHREKLLRSGANSVVPMNYIGGMRMASEMLRPEVVNFLDQMVRDKDESLRIEEVRLPMGSALDGQGLSAARAKALVLAVLTKDGSYIFNPPDDFQLEGGQTIIFMGSSSDKKNLESAVASG